MATDDQLVAELCRAAEREHGDADAVVRSHLRRVAPLVSADAGERLVRAAVARLDGLGALDALLADETVDEVLVNARGDIWVERDGRPRARAATSPPPTSPSSSSASSPRSAGASTARRRSSTPACPTARGCAP